MHRASFLVIVATACGTTSELDLTSFALTRSADNRVTAVAEAKCHTYTGGVDACPDRGTAPLCVQLNIFAASETEPCVPTNVLDSVEDCETVTLKGGETMTFTLTSTMVIPRSGLQADVLVEGIEGHSSQGCKYGAVP